MSLIVPLKPGKLGVSFSGKSDVVVSSIQEDGAMHDCPVKVGYIVVSLMLSNNKEITNFDKIELVRLLSENSEDPNRKIKFLIAYPDDIEINLPASENLGFVIMQQNGRPRVLDIAPDCKDKELISAGMVIDCIELPSSYKMIGYNAEEVKTLLAITSSVEGRKMHLKSPQSTLSEKTTKFDSITITIPDTSDGDLGLKLGGKVATVKEVEEGSPLVGTVLPGMLISALRVPNGSEFNFLPGYLLTEALEETKHIEGRRLRLVAKEAIEEDSKPVLRIFPTALGKSMEELGIKMYDNGLGKLFVDSVEETSYLNQILPHGLDGLSLLSTTYTDLSKPRAFRDHIIISEVFYNEPGASTSIEWVGLFNPCVDDIDITDWKLVKNDDTEKPTVKKIEKATIKSGGTMVFGKNGFESQHGFAHDHKLRFGLTNKGMLLTLKDNTDAKIDEVGWGRNREEWKSMYTAMDGQSIKRYSASKENVSKPTDWTINFVPTPHDVAIPLTQPLPVTQTPTTVEEFQDILLNSSGCDRHFTFGDVEQSFMPDECALVLPIGEDLGVEFEGDPAMISKIRDESPLMDLYVMLGMIVANIKIDGKTYYNLDNEDLTEKLKNSNMKYGRTMKCVNPLKI